MKYSSRLISNVRALFGFVRGLTVVTLVLLPIIAFLPGSYLNFPNLPLKTPTLVVKNTIPSEPERRIQIEDLSGRLKFTPATPEDRQLRRVIALVPGMAGLLFTFGVAHVLWRVCRNVEHGEIFSLRNVKLLRNLGVLLIIYSVTSVVIELWVGSHVLQYMRDHFSFNSLELPSAGPWWVNLKASTPLISINMNQLVIGLLVLCLAEVFRQGLKLQQEAALTV